MVNFNGSVHRSSPVKSGCLFMVGGMRNSEMGGGGGREKCNDEMGKSERHQEGRRN